MDISLTNKLYRQQIRREFCAAQQSGQVVAQQPAVVIMPQNMAQEGKEQVFQPAVYPGHQPGQYPGHQPGQYPGQQPVVVGVPPPGYSPQPQDPTQK